MTFAGLPRGSRSLLARRTCFFAAIRVIVRAGRLAPAGAGSAVAARRPAGIRSSDHGRVRPGFAAVRSEVETFRGEVRGEFHAVRAEADAFRAEVRSAFHAVRGEASTFRREV